MEGRTDGPVGLAQRLISPTWELVGISSQNASVRISDDHAETSAAALDARAGVAGGAPLRVRLLRTRPAGSFVQNGDVPASVETFLAALPALSR